MLKYYLVIKAIKSPKKSKSFFSNYRTMFNILKYLHKFPLYNWHVERTKVILHYYYTNLAPHYKIKQINTKQELLLL